MAGDLPSGTRLLAVLWAELVMADEAGRTQLASLRHLVRSHRGTITREELDPLVSLVAVFPASGDAVAAAASCQQASLTEPGKESSSPLRVGVSVGEASVERGEVYGLPVVEAARLCGVASGGQVLVSELACALARSGGSWTFEPAGTFELAGLAMPVAVQSLRWSTPDVRTAIPLPPSLSAGEGFTFVGRAAERGVLDRSWDDVRGGRRRAVLLAGEPGIGKTRLASEFAKDAHAQGGVVLYGRCDDGVGFAFQPFVGALRYYVAHSPQADLRSRLGAGAGTLARLVPEVAERVPDIVAPGGVDPELETLRLFDAVALWLAAASGRDPLVLVLDDLHWAARPTLLLLRHVLLAEVSMRILVVGTYRDAESGRALPLDEVVTDLRRGGAEVERILLDGLGEREVAALVAAAAGGDLAPETAGLVRAVWAESDGNPFFIGEIVRNLIDSGALYRGDHAWTSRVRADRLAIPETVRDAIRGRLSRLDDSAATVLVRAAVIGPAFDLDLLAAVSELEEDRLLGALDEAVANHLVEPVPGPLVRYRFAHALVRSTLYDELGAARRAQLHRRVGEALERLTGAANRDAGELARHFSIGAVRGDAGRAIEYAVLAGDRARDQFAHDDAAGWYRRALELFDAERGDDPARRHQLLLALGEAERRAGLRSHRETLLEAARVAEQHGDVDGLARSALANTRWVISEVGDFDRERVGVLERALAGLGGGDSPVRARLLATLASELLWADDAEARFDLSDQALAMARALGEPRTLVEVLIRRLTTIDAPDTLAEQHGNAEELLAVASSLDDPLLLFYAWLRVMRVAAKQGDRPRIDDAFAEVVRLGRELRQPPLQWLVVVGQASDALLLGDLAAAERYSLDGVRIGAASGQPEAAMFAGAELLVIRRLQGRPDELVPVAVPAVDARGVDFGQWATRLLHDAGRLDEARRRYEAVARRGFGTLRRDVVTGATLTNLAHLCARFGDRPRAPELYALLEPHAEQFHQTTFPQLATAHYLGMLDTTLGNFDDADRWFATAERLHERLRAPLYTAESRAEWARALLARGDRGDAERARSLLEQALGAAIEHGAAGIEADCRALLDKV